MGESMGVCNVDFKYGLLALNSTIARSPSSKSYHSHDYSTRLRDIGGGGRREVMVERKVGGAQDNML